MSGQCDRSGRNVVAITFTTDIRNLSSAEGRIEIGMPVRTAERHYENVLNTKR